MLLNLLHICLCSRLSEFEDAVNSFAPQVTAKIAVVVVDIIADAEAHTANSSVPPLDQNHIPDLYLFSSEHQSKVRSLYNS